MNINIAKANIEVKGFLDIEIDPTLDLLKRSKD